MNIKDWRKKRGITQEELAELVDVHVNTIIRWEKEEHAPRATDLKKIAKALNCSEADLLNGPSNEKITITLSYDWEKYEKGELFMDANLFEVFLGGHGEVGIKGAGLPKSLEELQELKAKICRELDNAFNYQLERGAIQSQQIQLA